MSIARSIPIFALAICAGAQQDSRAVFQKVCGSCHAADAYITRGQTRQQWQDTINSMVQRGAKATPDEFAATLDYLTAQFGPNWQPASPAMAGRGGPMAGRGRPQPGADNKHVVDAAAADRGRKVYAAECITCHGTRARGTDRGADLIRSELVLHDRYGNQIGPFLKKGHSLQTSAAGSLTQAQVEDLAHFVHQQVYETLRASLQIQNVLTGNADAGRAWFNGDGKCSTCHSPTGDFSGIARRYDPPALQQRFLFPMAGGGGRGRGGRGAPPRNPVTVTVTPGSGASITGIVVALDDFNVALRDSSGEYFSFKRTADLKVVKHDPFAAHEELLDRITDKNMHDIVAYLETLK
jgi:mono/diheme cytochrome c family protein